MLITIYFNYLYRFILKQNIILKYLIFISFITLSSVNATESNSFKKSQSFSNTSITYIILIVIILILLITTILTLIKSKQLQSKLVKSNVKDKPTLDHIELKNNEFTFNKDQQLLEVISKFISNGLIFTDFDGIITDINHSALQILGKSKSELINNHITDSLQFFESESMLMIESPVSKALYTKSNIILKEECCFMTDDGVSKFLKLSAFPIICANNNLIGAVLILYDISEQNKLRESWKQSQKLESIGKLASGIAHNFNNLLGGIMGFADLIYMNTSENNIKTYAMHIIKTSEDAAELTSHLLSFTQKSSSSIKKINIHECIKKSISILKHSIGTDINIYTKLNAQNHIIPGDIIKLQNVIINLGINAKNIMSGYGEFSIKTSNITLTQKDCSNSKFNLLPGEYISLTILNTGQNMPSGTIRNILNPELISEEFNEDSKLEFSTLLNTIMSHNGSIDIECSENGKTTYTIYLPTTLQTNNDKTSTSSIIQNKKTILLVDDQQISRSLERTIFENCGYNVLLAENGEQALKVYLEKGHTIDLVIMDLVMPVMGGEEATEHIIDMNPDAKIIISSGMEKSPHIDTLIINGKVKAFIPKPFTTSKFLKIVEEVL